MKNLPSADAAKRILHSKNEIIERWEKLVRSEFTEAEHEEKPQLIDSLPSFLDHLIDILAKGEISEKDFQKVQKVSEEHAEDRVESTEFTIGHIVREYHLLRKVILETLENDTTLDRVPRELIVEVIQTALTNATREFAELSIKKELSARELIREKDAVFRTIFELAAAGKAIVDQSTGKFMQVNKRFCDMLGYTEKELLEKTTTEITHPEDAHLVVNKPLIVNPSDSLEGKVWTVEKRYLQKDGTPLWALVSGALFPASINQPQRIIATIFDITEKKQIEILKDQFINTLTHDLRTPLSVITMATELLSLKKDDPVMVEKLIERIAANASRGDRMIQDLLDTSRIRSGFGLALDLAPCDLSQVIHDVVETLTSLHGDRFIVSGNTAPIKGYFSESGMRRLLENLCSNAIKYGAKELPVVIHVLQTSVDVSIAVQNKGEPIPKENLSTIFQQFSRTRSAQSSGKLGWGIGLTIVKGITEAHCGTITIESSASEGTTFTVKIPLDARPCQEERLKN
ncbi:hypothetical protein CIK05_09875 [Bdellovibrio sp. qaytius]|nr:hypothetical protein CIK05_09875 [Bdellovibrio sp. qaytius]